MSSEPRLPCEQPRYQLDAPQPGGGGPRGPRGGGGGGAPAPQPGAGTPLARRHLGECATLRDVTTALLPAPTCYAATTRNCQTYFSAVLTHHPRQCLQGFSEFAVYLNHHESARKRPNSIRLQYQICLCLSRTPPPQIPLPNPQELFPVRVPVLVMGLASNQGQVPCPTRKRSPHKCLVVSDLKPAPPPIPRSRNWFQI
jgi:hypothetical protein